jgi:hypothetical protein
MPPQAVQTSRKKNPARVIVSESEDEGEVIDINVSDATSSGGSSQHASDHHPTTAVSRPTTTAGAPVATRSTSTVGAAATRSTTTVGAAASRSTTVGAPRPTVSRSTTVGAPTVVQVAPTGTGGNVPANDASLATAPGMLAPLLPSAPTTRTNRAHDIDYFFTRGSKTEGTSTVCNTCR